jgi:hypothetical protein
MTRIKIVSNPYERSIKYFAFNEFVKDWEDIRVKNGPMSILWTQKVEHFLSA